MPIKWAALLLGACLCAVSGLARADEGSFDAFEHAHNAIAQTLSHKDALPSMDDPVYAQLVSQAFDASVLEATKQLPSMYRMGICHTVSATQAAYILRGATKEEMDPWATQLRLIEPQPDGRMARLKVENYVQFQDELVAALRFGMACRAMELEGTGGPAAQMTPDELSVFRMVFPDFQNGLIELVSYHVAALLYPIRPENRQAILDQLVQGVGPLADGMTRQSRQSAVRAVAKVLAVHTLAAGDREKLKTVQKALRRTDCGAFCSFH
jgi:hypothetical protein